MLWKRISTGFCARCISWKAGRAQTVSTLPCSMILIFCSFLLIPCGYHKDRIPWCVTVHEKCDAFLAYQDSISSLREQMDKTRLAGFLRSYTRFFNGVKNQFFGHPGVHSSVERKMPDGIYCHLEKNHWLRTEGYWNAECVRCCAYYEKTSWRRQTEYICSSGISVDSGLPQWDGFIDVYINICELLKRSVAGHLKFTYRHCRGRKES